MDARPAENKQLPGPMMVHHYAAYRWVQPVLMVLGAWLAMSPFSLGYSGALAVSDVVSGLAIIGIAALSWGRLGLWGGVLNAAVGAWLLFAPLLFWAKSPAAYATDTLVGGLVIAFAIILPMGHEMEGGEVPPGWSYNPSTWQQRAPVIALGLIGFFLSRAMAGHQLGYVDRIWDPFFGDSTNRVLESKMSRSWPVSDAGLGAATYLLEVLSGFMGDRRRWRTMPWMVAMFGFFVVPLGVVSIFLVMMQPIAVGAWCTPCLISAAAMLVMIPLSLDEVVAMLQLLARARREGKGVWATFWKGDHSSDAEAHAPIREVRWSPRPMLWGVSPALPLLASSAIGLWLLFAPETLGIGIQGAAANSDHILGALIVVNSVIAMAEVVRPARLLNVLFGGWLLVAPWLLDGGTSATRLSSVLSGALVIALSVPAGKVLDHYGRLDRAARWRPGRKATA